MPNLKALAEDRPAWSWAELQRPPRYTVQGEPRRRPEKVKDRIVRERGFKTLTRVGEDVAEVGYRPTACHLRRETCEPAAKSAIRTATRPPWYLCGRKARSSWR